MELQIQDLVSSIKKDGIESANREAAQILADAKAQAEKIVADARNEADKLRADAQAEIGVFKASAQLSAEQAKRDAVLAFRQEIGAELTKLLARDTHKALDDKALAALITAALQGEDASSYAAEVASVTDALKSELAGELKAGLELRLSKKVHTGFRLCAKDGSGYIDCSDEELAVFRRREVGLVYQFYNLVPVLNVVENMTLPVALDGRTVNAGRLQGLVQRLGLAGREGHLPSQLSGGQQQRVAIGRALMSAPAVVLADEPTGNLDTRNSCEIMQLLRDSNREFGQTMIVITHDEEIALAADRIIAVEDGCIVRDERIRR